LAFENKFDYLRHPVENKKVLGRPYGIKFELEGTKHILLVLSDDEELLTRFRNFLSQRIN